MNPDQNRAADANASTPKSLADEVFKEATEPHFFSYSSQMKGAVASLPLMFIVMAGVPVTG